MLPDVNIVRRGGLISRFFRALSFILTPFFRALSLILTPFFRVLSFIFTTIASFITILFAFLRRAILTPISRLRCLSPFASASPPVTRVSTKSNPTDSSRATRGLSYLLYKISCLPMSSNKYNLVFSLADQIIDNNISSPMHMLKELNCTSLAEAFKRTIASIEVTIKAETSRYTGNVLWFMRKRRVTKAGFEHLSKLSIEAIWLAQKMEKNGSASTGVAIWGSASGLSELAMSADPWFQLSLGCICVFMFNLADSEELDQVINGTKYQLSILKTWLPFLCRMSNKVQACIANFEEANDMVPKLIEKLTLEEQKEVLFLWLHHYTEVDFDWINLKECYMSWCFNYQMEFANAATG